MLDPYKCQNNNNKYGIPSRPIYIIQKKWSTYISVQKTIINMVNYIPSRPIYISKKTWPTYISIKT